MTQRDETRLTQDVLDLLQQDHQRVKEMFSRFEKEQADLEDEENARLVRDIGMEIMVHAVLEEELFYPAAAEALGEEGLVDQALVEHQAARDLLDKLAGEEPEEEMWTARVHVLGKYVAHHIGEEENLIFPRLRKAGFGQDDLARRIQDRKQVLMRQAANLDLQELAALGGAGH